MKNTIEVWKDNVVYACAYLEDGATIRSVAKKFKRSKDTIQKRLNEYCYPAFLVDKVRAKIELNKEQRAVRGGEATKKLILNISAKKKCVNQIIKRTRLNVFYCSETGQPCKECYKHRELEVEHG